MHDDNAYFVKVNSESEHVDTIPDYSSLQYSTLCDNGDGVVTEEWGLQFYANQFQFQVDVSGISEMVTLDIVENVGRRRILLSILFRTERNWLAKTRYINHLFDENGHLTSNLIHYNDDFLGKIPATIFWVGQFYQHDGVLDFSFDEYIVRVTRCTYDYIAFSIPGLHCNNHEFLLSDHRFPSYDPEDSDINPYLMMGFFSSSQSKTVSDLQSTEIDRIVNMVTVKGIIDPNTFIEMEGIIVIPWGFQVFHTPHVKSNVNYELNDFAYNMVLFLHLQIITHREVSFTKRFICFILMMIIVAIAIIL